MRLLMKREKERKNKMPYFILGIVAGLVSSIVVETNLNKRGGPV